MISLQQALLLGGCHSDAAALGCIILDIVGFFARNWIISRPSQGERSTAKAFSSSTAESPALSSISAPPQARGLTCSTHCMYACALPELGYFTTMGRYCLLFMSTGTKAVYLLITLQALLVCTAFTWYRRLDPVGVRAKVTVWDQKVLHGMETLEAKRKAGLAVSICGIK